MIDTETLPSKESEPTVNVPPVLYTEDPVCMVVVTSRVGDEPQTSRHESGNTVVRRKMKMKGMGEAPRGMRRVGNKTKNGEAKGESDRGAMDNSTRGRITRSQQTVAARVMRDRIDGDERIDSIQERRQPARSTPSTSTKPPPISALLDSVTLL